MHKEKITSLDHTKRPTDRSIRDLRPRTYITPNMLWLGAAAVISLVCALILPWLGTVYALALVMIFPVIIIGIYILKNPFNGVFIYFLYEFLRPYDFIIALQPLRLALVIEIVTVVSWIVAIARFRPAIKWDKLNWMYLAFLGSMAIGVLLAVNTFRAYNVFQLILVNFVMYIVATNTIDTVKRLEKVLWLLIVTHVYFAIFGIYNFIFNPGISGGLETSGIVGSSFVGDENDFAMTINIMIPIVFFLSAYYRRGWQKKLCYAILILFMAGVVASFSRGGLVGLVAAVSFCIWFSGRRVVYFTMALLIGLVFMSFNTDKYLTEIKTIGDTSEATADARLRYWAAAGKIFLDHPIIGVGADNGGMHMPDYIGGEANPRREWGRAVHGLFPQVASELGAIGIILYLAMLYYVLSFLNRIRKRKAENDDQLKMNYIALSLIGSIVAFVATSTFLSTAYYPQLWTIYVLAISVLWIRRGFDQQSLAAAG